MYILYQTYPKVKVLPNGHSVIPLLIQVISSVVFLDVKDKNGTSIILKIDNKTTEIIVIIKIINITINEIIKGNVFSFS